MRHVPDQPCRGVISCRLESAPGKCRAPYLLSVLYTALSAPISHIIEGLHMVKIYPLAHPCHSLSIPSPSRENMILLLSCFKLHSHGSSMMIKPRISKRAYKAPHFPHLPARSAPVPPHPPVSMALRLPLVAAGVTTSFT